MRKMLVVAAGALGLMGTVGVIEASTIFHASMTFDQEVPTVPAPEGASGVATFVLNDAQNALSYDVLITGLNFPPATTPGPTDMTRLHIHRGMDIARQAVTEEMTSLHPDVDVAVLFRSAPARSA